MTSHFDRPRRRIGLPQSAAAPRRFAVFDHVPKTGGTAVNHALLKIFSAEHVAINRHVDVASGKLDFADRYPIITGHFGGNWRRQFQESRDRVALTVIRDPVDRAISTYAFWRHCIPSGHADFWAPTVQAAKTLRFGAFIRSEERSVKINLFNTHYALLTGGEGVKAVCEAAGQARYRGKTMELAVEFDVIGVTERLPETLQCFLTAIGFQEPLDVRAVLARVPKNASPALDETEISSEDRTFLAERNELDFDLHAAAGARLDRLLQADGKAAANESPRDRS